MIPLLLALTGIFILKGYYVYKLQQKGNQIGGAISRAKSFWLSYVLFNYLALSIVLLIYTPADFPFYYGLLVFVILIYFRSIVQMLMMYKFKNWKPLYGIGSNLFFFLVTLFFLIHDFTSLIFSDWQLLILPLFLVKICMLLLCDSYYAYVFHKAVGNATTGDQAIWFAGSHDARFNAVNSLTFQLNIVFSVVTLLIIVITIAVYG